MKLGRISQQTDLLHVPLVGQANSVPEWLKYWSHPVKRAPPTLSRGQAPIPQIAVLAIWAIPDSMGSHVWLALLDPTNQ